MALEELQNGRYHRLRLLGSGGMGEVYLMEDMRINRQVAIKVIRSEGAAYPDSASAKDAARLFQREARAIAALEHPHILPLYDFGEETLDNTTITYMVMPFTADGSLAGWLRQRGNPPRLSLQDISYLVEQAAESLQYAHDHHVIHLDVKPSNFLLRANAKKPDRPTLLLADFGIARNSATIASSSRTIRGTPTAMAPEQWSSTPTAATDQYALAVMVYEMLTGRPPFLGSMEQLMYQHFSAQPPAPSIFNPQLSADIDAVILRALAKKPEDRFPSVSAFATAFEEAVQTLPSDLVVKPQESSDVYATLDISPTEARSGTSRVITLPGGEQLTVPVPSGVDDGQVIHVQNPDKSSSLSRVLTLAIAIKQSEKADALVDALTVASPDQTPHTPPSIAQREKVIEPGKEQTPHTPLPLAPLPSDPVSGHDLPTVAASAPDLQTAEKQPQLTPPRRQGAPRSRLVSIVSALIVVVLLLLLLAGTAYFYSSHQASVTALALSQTATASAKPVPTPTHAPTVTITPTPTPTPQKGLYIAGTYKGSMTDQITNQATFFTILLGQTKGFAPLTGLFVPTSSSQQYSLKGTVDTQGNFSFTIQQAAGQKPLFFHGQFQQDYLNGHYCSSNTNSCPVDTGYFSAGPRF